VEITLPCAHKSEAIETEIICMIIRAVSIAPRLLRSKEAAGEDKRAAINVGENEQILRRRAGEDLANEFVWQRGKIRDIHVNASLLRRMPDETKRNSAKTSK